MANRPKGYGITAELQQKKDAKWDPDLCTKVVEWLKLQLSSDIDKNTESIDKLNGVSPNNDDLHEVLKDGVILCNVINTLKPGSVKKINETEMAFKQMENISQFLAASQILGCAKVDMFQTVDLYEKINMPLVINGILALARKFSKSGFGLNMLKESKTLNKREFTEEQLRAGEGLIGLQAGSNKGASQAGQNFGKTRAIID